MKEPAHKVIINNYLDWNLVQTRLNTYKNINDCFSLKQLQSCSEKPPYYCHYMGLRLGTWKHENWFSFFDNLLEIGKQIKGWQDKSKIPKGCDFDNFWSFIWELQVANLFFTYPDLKLEWTKSGPDLQATIDHQDVYIECTTYHKSFGLEEFINELFMCISPDILVTHAPFMKFSLPKNNDEVRIFLEELFSPFLDRSYLIAKIDEAKLHSPIILNSSSGEYNFYVYLENPDAPNLNLAQNQKLSSTGEPCNYLKTAISEGINNKVSTNANNLLNFHPNLLMINYLLGVDWQLAKSLRSFPKYDLDKDLDGIFMTACGIDKLPDINNSIISFQNNNHPLRQVLIR